MWKHIPQSYFHGSRVPEIDVSPNSVTVTEEEPRLIGAKLFPEGICTTCQGFTLHNLLKTGDGMLDELLWVDYDRSVPTNCAMCTMIFENIVSGGFAPGKIGLGWGVDDKKLETDMRSKRQIHQFCQKRVRGLGARYAYTMMTLRVYAERGTTQSFGFYTSFITRSDSDRFIRFKICTGYARIIF